MINCSSTGGITKTEAECAIKIATWYTLHSQGWISCVLKRPFLAISTNCCLANSWKRTSRAFVESSILHCLSKFQGLPTVLLLSETNSKKECCNEIKHEDKLPFSTPSQPCLLNKHCRLDSLALQSLHPESPIDPPRRFLQAVGKKRRAEKDGETEEGQKKKGKKAKETGWIYGSVNTERAAVYLPL